MLVLEVSFRSRTCPTRPAEPVDRIEPSATSQGAPRSDSTVWVCFSLRSSECFPATLVETRDPDQTTNELKKRVRKQKGHLSESQIILWFFFFFLQPTLLTSGISKGTLRTCMPCRTTGLGWSMDSTGAPSWTSVEVKLDDWDCRSLSL